MATTSAKSKTSGRAAGGCSVPPGEPVPVIKGSHVYLIDGSGYIFRAFHALPPLTRPSDGLPVGAVHGFCAMLWKLLQDARKGRGPTHLAVIFDASEKTFRNEIYKDYKAHRPPAPEELVPQFPLIRDAVKAFNIACIEQNGYEADDLIATYTKETLASGGDVTIVSSDKDLMQLVQSGVSMLDTMKNKTIGPDEVRERFGVPPDKVIDVQALAGDSTDNVPGVPGIGVKTAAELINEYGDLESLLARAGEIKQPKRRERLTEFAMQARLSLDLVKLKDDVPREVPVEQLGVRDPAGGNLARLPARDGILDADQADRGRAGRRDAAAGRAAGSPERATFGSCCQAGKVGRQVWRGCVGRRTDRRRCRRTEGSDGKNRPVEIRDGHRAAASGGLDRTGPCCGPLRLRHRDDQPRPDAGRVRRLLHGRGARQGLLRAAGTPRGKRQLRLRRCQSQAGAGQRSAGGPQAAARRSVRAQDRAEPEIRLSGPAPARHRAGAARRHHAAVLCPGRRAAASTAWIRCRSVFSSTRACPSRRCSSMHRAPRNPTRRSRRCRSRRRPSMPARTPT